ncbi:RNA polymerase sigma factor [Salibacter sp.]|uniref:RNA polymerase sigma factor n=1 Tax=Salibacter sp. TaxID=2010995 RepID=UPI002870A93D|nr:RNA polymerase sigma factor [Salibacter sp.]MDR9399116.1 RNA polymerase sigma factor [Salibacter sp.]MDR9488169.1 RNA polymerase sigma factor [Salibacter sp.]
MELVYTKRLNSLIDGCCDGNRKCQRELYNLFKSKMFGVSMRYAQNRALAEDILQESFIKVFKSIKTYKGEGSFEGWMRRILVHTALRYIDKEKRYRCSDEEVESLSIDKSVLNDAMQSLEHEELTKLVDNLPDGYRQIFSLYAIEGFTHKEIAEKFEISIGTSKSQLARARKLLKTKVIELYKRSVAQNGQSAG